MFTEYELNRISTIFDEMLNTSRKKMRKKSLIFMSIIVILSILVFYILIKVNAFESYNDRIWYFVLSIIFFLIPFIAFIVSYHYRDAEIFYNYVYKEVIEHINHHTGTFYQYKGKEKNSKLYRDMIKEGGLYPAASIYALNRITGYSKAQYPFEMYQLRVVSSNGQSSMVHFDGIYIVLKLPIASMFQIRTNGRPHQKEVKLRKIDKIDKISIYKPEDEQMAIADQKYLAILKKLMDDENICFVDIASNLSNLHLGIQYKKQPNKKIKELDYDAMNSIVKYYMDIFAIIDSLES